MRERILEVRRLGLIDYETALNLQKETEIHVIAREKNDTLFLLEHPHTYTLGRRAKEDGILASAKLLEALGAKVYETNRGGKVTYHGLGQLVGYPIINLSAFKEDVHLYVRNIEEVLIRTMNDFGIEAFRIKDLTGVHTRDGKVAAIGVHLKRWVTTHGFALNLNTDLNYFNHIIACEGETVASMNQILGRELTFAEVEEKIVKNFVDVFEYKKVIEFETEAAATAAASHI
jgi:lipoyl(octanoyl) transferase